MFVGDWKVKETGELLRISGDSENRNFWIEAIGGKTKNVSFNFIRSMYKHDGILRGRLFLGEDVSKFEKNVIYNLEVKIDEHIEVFNDEDQLYMSLEWVGGESSK